MQKIKQLFIIRYLILLPLVILTLISCDNESQKIKYPPLAKYYPATEKYPEGYSDVIMGDLLLRVPWHIAPIRSQGSFAIYVSWPEFEPVRGKNFRSSSMQNVIDTISIFFSPPRQHGKYDGTPHQQGLDAKERTINVLKSLEHQWIISTEFPGFKETNTKPTNHYISTDQNLVNPFGLPQMFFCATLNRGLDWDKIKDHSKLPPECNMGVD